jgi:lipoate-protein ligase A
MWIDDMVFKNADKPLHLELWIPKSPVLVLGRSNDEARECEQNNCAKLGIPILKRAGGGGAVVLHSGCLVVAIGAWMQNPFRNDHYFSLINQTIAKEIESNFRVPPVKERGISDLAIMDKKIAGTSLFRSKGYLLYQCSILIDTKIELIEACLKHPSKEPDYRQGKSHREFIAGLNEFNRDLTPELLFTKLSQTLSSSLQMALSAELAPVDLSHLAWILKKVDA